MEGGHRCQRQRNQDGADQLVRSLQRLPVVGEVVAEGNYPLAAAGCQDERGVEGEQRGRRIADRRPGTEVAADRGAVADQSRGELREHLRQQRHPAREHPLDLAQRQRSTKADLFGPNRELSQLGEPIHGDDQGSPYAAQVHLDADIGRPGNDLGVGPVGQQLEDLVETRRPEELRPVDRQPRGCRRGRR